MTRKEVEQMRLDNNSKRLTMDDLIMLTSMDLAFVKLKKSREAFTLEDILALSSLYHREMADRHNKNYGIDVKEFGK